MRRQLTTLPELHFLLIAPDLGSEWFFDAARRYWDRFRPTVISDLALVVLVPPARSTAVTILTRRDRVADFGVLMAQVAPLAYFDPVVYDTVELARAALNERADMNQPFGTPLLTPFPTLDLTQSADPPFIPTPNIISTRPPAGFVTATPVPPPTGGTPAQTAIERTPGPITGGG